MKKTSDDRWRSLAKWLRMVGIVCFAVSFLSWLALVEVYYPFKRPVLAQPERGWTIPLSWTHPPLYGAAKDEKRIEWLFQMMLPGFGLVVLGELIKIYKLGDLSGLRRKVNPTWNHKWGP
ncbi:MAG TPA: hypothetical protein VHT24_07930 [Pseudacidobacterium sp.]|nr:hypothetical protein [Pseudacidobacterium sp.]